MRLDGRAGSRALAGVHRRRRGRRQLEQEGRALVVLRLDPDAAAHSADQLLADVEPEPGAPHAAHHVRVDAVELLEDPLLLLGRDSEALVANVEADVRASWLRADLDPTPVGRVLDRVL